MDNILPSVVALLHMMLVSCSHRYSRYNSIPTSPVPHITETRHCRITTWIAKNVYICPALIVYSSVTGIIM